MNENERKLLILVAKTLLGGVDHSGEQLEELVNLINKLEDEDRPVVQA